MRTTISLIKINGSWGGVPLLDGNSDDPEPLPKGTLGTVGVLLDGGLVGELGGTGVGLGVGFGVGCGVAGDVDCGDWAEAANGANDTILAIRGTANVTVRGMAATALANQSFCGRVREKRISRKISMLELKYRQK